MKHAMKFFSLTAVLILVVALTGCVTDFRIAAKADWPTLMANELIIVSYEGDGDGTIIKATHTEKNIATGEEYTYNMLLARLNYDWVTKTVPDGTKNEVVCFWFAHHGTPPGKGYSHTFYLTIQDTGGQTETAGAILIIL